MTPSYDQLCLALMRCETEDEVLSLLQVEGYWDNRDLWRPIDDNENNFSTIGNQQGEAIAALSEKIVNGIDARLINACCIAGVDPEGPDAPGTMRAAVARFFENRSHPREDDGQVASWTDAGKITREAELLTLAATGQMPKKGKQTFPSLSIADQGEGQTPDSFPRTFMSLGKSNKLRIRFVQGKFNMGGTGAFQFCHGQNKLQLIVSRRNPALLSAGSTQRDQQWGFTVVRREAPTGQAKSSVFTYLAPVGADSCPRGGNVLAFSADTWPIFPRADSQGRDAYARQSEYGSLIKLYEYEWLGTRTNIIIASDGLLRRVDTSLPELALPVRLYECREGYSGHAGSFATNALGLVARLNNDKADNLELARPIDGTISLDGRQIPVWIYAFKPDKAKAYRNSRVGVICTVNGQSHGGFSIDFFRRKTVNLPYLADSLLVIADCSAIDGQMREDLFMNSRDRLRDRPVARRLESQLEMHLKDESILRELQNQRRQQALTKQIGEDKPLADVFTKLLRSNPSLSKLFLQGLRLPSPFPPGGGQGKGSAAVFHGRRFPTFFRFKGQQTGLPYSREAHIGSRVRIAFETDADDDYFSRVEDAGALSVSRLVDGNYVDEGSWSHSALHEGAMRLIIAELPEDAEVGEKLEYRIEITDPGRVDAFVNDLRLLVLPEQAGGGGGGAGGSSTRNEGRGKDGNGSTLAMPEIQPVHRDDWGKAPHNFNEESALAIIGSGEEIDRQPTSYDFFVNVDNKYLKTAEKSSRTPAEILEKQFTYALVLVGMAMLHDANDHGTDKQPAQGSDATQLPEEPNIEETIRLTTRALAPVILPIIESIGGLADGPED